MMRSKFFALVAVLALIPTAANAWWQNDWSFRKQISLDTTLKGANIDQPVGRIPVLIRLHSGNFSFTDAQENGTDLRFVAADDKTPLAYHVESFDPLLGVADVWVDVPNLGAGTKQDIWLYYSNKKATPGGDTGASFDPDYALVYHFDGAAATPPKDETANKNDAQSAPDGVDEGGIIGKSARFLGTNAVSVAASPSLAVAAGGNFTFSTWVKSDAPQAKAALYGRHDGAAGLVIGLDQGVPFVDISGGTGAGHLAAPQAVAKGQWTHIAVTADGKSVTLYVNGKATTTAAATLPAMNSVTVIGRDVAPVAGVAPASEYAAFVGEMDELRISKVARPAAVILAGALSEGPDSKLVVFGEDEKQSGFGFGYFGIIIQHVTIDAWVVISLLGIMAAVSWFVMWGKATYLNTVDRANDIFLDLFRKTGGDPLALESAIEARRDKRKLGNSSIYRIYRAAADEIKRRAEKSSHVVLNAEAIEVIRALMDANLVRENQRLSRSMVLLTISISGGPFLGLLGTVVGVMITFAAIAAAGDVNINAIAPGISAALLATVAGLGVAIPALFGYNYLLVRSKNITANMQVFVDEFVTRLSEIYREQAYRRAAE
jgi:biopolymer transport protein ExbB